ncbi:MAG: DDE-type integrase/transposase/recombinase [Eubacterium sp.]|nr:DDE-type integrase/transposase/recombinase [Eubacterium sp.]
MEDKVISVGTILADTKTCTRYRVIAITGTSYILCELDTTRFILIEHLKNVLHNLILDGDIVFEPIEKNTRVVDVDSLPPKTREKYEIRLQLMNEVLSVYGPTYMGLMGKSSKKELYILLKKYNCPSNTFWRACTKYFQSGLDNNFLIDGKHFRGKKTTYHYQRKPGAPAKYFNNSNIIPNASLLEHFEEGLKYYKSGRDKTIKKAFDRILLLHYSHTVTENGIGLTRLLPDTDRPTYRQFQHFVNKHLSKQEKDKIKTSAAEQRNNKRLLLSDSLYGIMGPCDMVEIDACEADVSLVSSINDSQSIGRPIVYFMIDVYTRMILAMSVSLDNNSYLGVTNLFLNLFDDKHSFCAKFDMDFENDDIWPSNILPRRIRVDRGAEFLSQNFEKLCLSLGIEKHIVSGASGSLKGTVEQSFHQMHESLNAHLENYGLIEKRYDSNHHKEATLTIDDFTKLIINFVWTHNQKNLPTYQLTKEMLEKDVPPIPARLWTFGINKFGHPRKITNKAQYLYDLMSPINAKVSRNGITYKGLYYYNPNDKHLNREMFNAGKKQIPFEARMDMRDVSRIYYIRDNLLMVAELNTTKTGNGDYIGMTMAEYLLYDTKKKKINALGARQNEEISAHRHSFNSSIVRNAKKDTNSNDKNIRHARELDKQMISHTNKIATRLEPNPYAISQEEIPKSTPSHLELDVNDPDYWSKAIEDFRNRH